MFFSLCPFFSFNCLFCKTLFSINDVTSSCFLFFSRFFVSFSFSLCFPCWVSKDNILKNNFCAWQIHFYSKNFEALNYNYFLLKSTSSQLFHNTDPLLLKKVKDIQKYLITVFFRKVSLLAKTRKSTPSPLLFYYF